VECAFFIGALIGVCTKEITLCLNDMCELIVFFLSVSSVSMRKNARETVRATRALNSYLEKLAPAGVECAFFIRPLIGVCTEEITLCLNDM
jgi:hypothetical protein